MIPAPISAFFAPVAVRIMAAVIAVLLVLLAVAMWRADGLSKDKRDLQDDLATEQVQHLVTTASVDRLTGELETMMASALARQKQLDASREQVERDAAKLVALERGTDAKIARLRALANKPRPQSCPVPPELLRELKGL